MKSKTCRIVTNTRNRSLHSGHAIFNTRFPIALREDCKWQMEH